MVKAMYEVEDAALWRCRAMQVSHIVAAWGNDMSRKSAGQIRAKNEHYECAS
ncbi:MAG TPA: hypothetical protein VMJ11_07315 [Paraburkholderia sp.]|uniref:hypothetical protein n=1 Tax=Paraburkholderia sp. TaxID=1926495 RepID=UPI002CAB910B|nr:hypothetical protein [Paraburkholderia sp.]HTR06456.1 hypothetical protein [Paraburkholderia sp.]